MTSTTVEFDDVSDDRYGGKAAGLADLRRLGLSVPVGFVIADASADSSNIAVAERFSQMTAAGTTPVAVRSSAVGEDGDNQFFAGQYDTVLGVDSVDDFTEAVRACTASGVSPVNDAILF